jgi:hypothetical protein
MTTVTIPPVSDIATMAAAVDAYAYSAAAASLPAAVQAALKQFYPSPVDKICRAGEALYAGAASLDSAGQALCAQLANFAMIAQWHAIGQGSRGVGVVLAMRRRLGDATVTQTEGQDPPADPQFVAVKA